MYILYPAADAGVQPDSDLVNFNFKIDIKSLYTMLDIFYCSIVKYRYKYRGTFLFERSFGVV